MQVIKKAIRYLLFTALGMVILLIGYVYYQFQAMKKGDLVSDVKQVEIPYQQTRNGHEMAAHGHVVAQAANKKWA